MTGTDSSGPDRREALDHLAEPSEDGGRRGFLRGVAASAAAAVGLSGTAAALDPTGEVALEQLRRQYAAPSVAEAALRNHGGDLLAALADREYLADGIPEEFDDVNGTSLVVGGSATGHVTAQSEIDGGKLTVVVEPQNDRAYAVDDSGDRWTVMRLRDGSLEAEPTDVNGTVCLSTGRTCTNCEVVEFACDEDGCIIVLTGICCTNCQAFCPC